MRTTHSLTARNQNFALGTANVLISFVLSFTWAIVIFIWLLLAAVLVPVLGIGVPLLVMGLATLGAVLRGERGRARAVYGIDAVPLQLPVGTASDGAFRRWFKPYGTRLYWSSVGHHILKLLLGLIGGLAFFYFIGSAVAGLLAPFSEAIRFRFLFFFELDRWSALAAGFISLFIAIVAMWAVIAADRAIDEALLTAEPEQLRKEITELETARSDSEAAAEAERRRIERDLHDGAQPRLVNLALTLGMAKSKIETDPETARALMDEAHTEAKMAVSELRQLARGIHPAVLTDRGLDAALSALAASMPIDVEVQVDLAQRLPEHVESVAYFVVAEALTNVAKHAEATRAVVNVKRDRNMMRIYVFDNGKGGATITTNGFVGGLPGLKQRISAARGTMSLSSPPGGPTILTAEVPCA